MTRYRVHVGGRRYRYFETLEAAKRFCDDVFRNTGIVLAIQRTEK